ncbi:isochorismatase family protein [Pelomicrobium sp. G1]|uniref:isochorismatase family protein n=1 Tax=unclassified Pelomicrobium TaxID=2815318 RepID=UPI003F75F784
MTVTVSPGDALIVVDVQNDFLPGGALAVPQGDQVIEPLNRAAVLFEAKGLPVFATRDWHPENHCSFKAQGGPWPPHCVAGTRGAEFAPGLRLPASAVVISKATTPERDAYSGFQGTELAELLRRRGVKRVVVGGLATDYCVLNTVKDALTQGFQVLLLIDAIRAVDVKPGDGEAARTEMERAGAVPITVADLA